ncbi:hypothetical protein B566_EDAN002338 [Ephemera danica]|nr:hypothetical protein B566_EDAN002338 [Ephemera danica]
MRSYLIFFVSALIPFASSIVSENQAQLGEIPWQISVNGPSWYLCGGVILSEDFVISSASCTSLNHLLNLANMNNLLVCLSLELHHRMQGQSHYSLYSAPVSEVLLKAELPVMNQDQCEGSHGPQKGAFCTNYGSSNEDPCQNDSGGPLTANGELVGILVKAYGCHQLVRLPALHADVAFHGAWIRDVTGLP